MDHMKKRQMTSDLLMDIAITLMECGAHTSRVIHDINRIANAFNYDLELTILQKSIMTTITYRHNEAVTHTAVRRTKPSHLNLRVLSDLTLLSWQVAENRPTLDELRRRYEAILHQPPLSRWLVLIMASAANASFCRLFHGDWATVGLVFLGTAIAFFLRQQLLARHTNLLMAFILCAFCSSLVVGLGTRFPITDTANIAIGTSVLFLIPGVPLINSVLDLIEGYALSGLSRLINALNLVFCIALGLGATLILLRFDPAWLTP